LSAWASQTKEHWKKHRPKLYQGLQKSGRLDEAARRAVSLTEDELGELIEKGLHFDQAWELVREKYMFLPSEEDQPELGL